MIIFSSAKDGEALYSQQKQDQELPGLSGSDQLLIEKFRLQQRKMGKTSRPFRYDLNQIPYDYTVEVTNIFMVLDLADRVLEEVLTEVHILYRGQ